MNQEKIGKFIAMCRKKKNLTQQQLADKIFVTDRAISKWETGKGMPDSSIMLALCKELDITVNELLSAEYILEENYKEKSEENLYSISKKEEENAKKLFISESIIVALTTITFITLISVATFCNISQTIKILLYVFAFLIFILSISFTIKIETEVGYYECKKCKHKYIPKYLDVFLAIHIGRSKYLKCPKCKKHSFNKKIIK